MTVSSQAFNAWEINKTSIKNMLKLPNDYHFPDNLPLSVASVGSPKLLVPLDSPVLLEKLKPNYELIKEWSIENLINGLYVYAENPAREREFYARGINPKTGHNEDAATGIAAAALSLAIKKDIKVEQGHALGKPCSIIISYINPKNILVGGEVSRPERLNCYL